MTWILGEPNSKEGAHGGASSAPAVPTPHQPSSFRMGHTVEMHLWQLWWLTSLLQCLAMKTPLAYMVWEYMISTPSLLILYSHLILQLI